MPDISKINALAIGSVSKVDGLAKASILDIDGVAVLSVPAAAYSVRLLGSAVGISSYTGAAMRVRRDTAGGTGDDDEADIAFDTSLTDPTISLDSAISNASAGVTATTLGEFLNVGTVNSTTYSNPDSLSGTASCFVDEWKDQSGNAAHASQATFESQSQIHDGTVNTDLITENGKPALKPLNNGDQFENSNTGITGQYAFGVVKTTDALNSIMLSSNTSANIYLLAGVNGATFAASDSTSSPTYYKNGSSYSPSDADAVNTDLQSQTLIALSYTSFNHHLVGYPWSSSRAMMISQEIIIYNSDQSSNRPGIETNINGFFGIY